MESSHLPTVSRINNLILLEVGNKQFTAKMYFYIGT